MNGETERQDKGRIEQIKEQAGNIAGKARESLNKLNESTAVYQEGSKEFLDSVGLYIKENPQRSAMIAILTGIGLGIVLGRISKRGRHD